MLVFANPRPHPPALTAPSLLIVEIGVTLFIIVLAFCCPLLGNAWLVKVEAIFDRVAAKRKTAILAIALSTCLLRLLVLPFVPVPQPFIHDEFSHLLAADTFASGRLSNPTHPMWKHMESFHIEFQPTYMSEYFPAQGAVLATGKLLGHNPWIGVLLSVGLMCGFICWMLQGWLPLNSAFLGAWLVVFRLGLLSYWMNSYYGGAVSAIGGALVLGAIPRARRSFRVRYLCLMALGVVILAVSRPYEGLLISLPAGLYLLPTLGREFRMSQSVALKRITPAAFILLTAAGCMAYYNQRVFDHPFVFPYTINASTYLSAPQFLWQSPKPEPLYRHREMRDFYTGMQLAEFKIFQTPSGFFSQCGRWIGIFFFFFCGIALFPVLIALPRVLADPRLRFMAVLSLTFAVGLSMNGWFFPHYAGSFTPALYVLILESMRRVRHWTADGRQFGLALTRFIPIACLLLAVIRVFADPLHIGVDRWPYMWYGTEPLGIPRASVIAALKKVPGNQLAIVKYSAKHNPVDDWVYNSADIDASKIVWARDMGAENNRELFRYFATRRIWVIEPDATPPQITPYTPNAF